MATKVRDPRIGFTTITDVIISNDMKFAKVFFSVMGSEEEKRKAAEGLSQARGFLQKDIAHTLKLRFTPHLNFILDSSLDEAMKIDALIHQIHKEDRPKKQAEAV